MLIPTYPLNFAFCVYIYVFFRLPCQNLPSSQKSGKRANRQKTGAANHPQKCLTFAKWGYFWGYFGYVLFFTFKNQLIMNIILVSPSHGIKTKQPFQAAFVISALARAFISIRQRQPENPFPRFQAAFALQCAPFVSRFPSKAA